MIVRAAQVSMLSEVTLGDTRAGHSRYDPAVLNIQRTYRRLEPLHLVFALVWGLGMLIPVLAHRSKGPGVVASLLALDAAGLIWVYLAAPAASIVVTSGQVIVRNPFRRHVVPRRLIEGVDTETALTPRLLVRNAPPIRLAALNLNLARGYQVNAGRHQRLGVGAMLEQVPVELNDGQVDRRVRYGHVLLAAVAVGVTLAAVRYLLSIEQL
ncbi:PH domain-containing protein [Catellatospora chokoriensis]|uniref:PH domain-containing protein n=1 Tax=Catellatospora chokoriensis TaxID=310353 RepID=A0A8J3NTS6_9ACTN|nr:PH domain-containing protein [Catellatospora chokoriensis]GIF90485.1 hypothetical protein Cch02nite_39290 [Catellatospora chokoriensis]